jgi:hypothetical protein
MYVLMFKKKKEEEEEEEKRRTNKAGAYTDTHTTRAPTNTRERTGTKRIAPCVPVREVLRERLDSTKSSTHTGGAKQRNRTKRTRATAEKKQSNHSRSGAHRDGEEKQDSVQECAVALL